MFMINRMLIVCVLNDVKAFIGLVRQGLFWYMASGSNGLRGCRRLNDCKRFSIVRSFGLFSRIFLLFSICSLNLLVLSSMTLTINCILIFYLACCLGPSPSNFIVFKES